ncbi:glycosyl hydrolase family 85 protein [Zymoseptoria brevis]|uniref:Glycosyl hydrolase family 85 protein n=1 Tax=Zymoseptoria brevis TaxID=1047168 RepID=A0A0F4GLB3_9PEZI|nr:glycosyl hydrolase family 85 protein [Zymoseptoria brevis]
MAELDAVRSITPRCRDAQRRYADRLKGFAYLESFDELEAWTEDDVDSLQKANTPLMRAESLVLDHNNDKNGKSRVMLIHDYKGGYNDYESCQGAAVEKDMYSCEFLQHVETFVYFSHKLVSVPPPTWTNTCHRNGVAALGTFLVEPGSIGVERILECDEEGIFWVARKLALVAKEYGFDGWLINIEIGFPMWAWSLEKLEGFLRQLRSDLGPKRKVVWYDALTTLNFVWYQNTFNSLNSPYALAAGSILTNYAWRPDLAASAKDLAEKTGLGAENVYFGIDMWAQNAQYGRNRRTTWPREGGGGTGTGLGLDVLKTHGLGVGIFAPGWPFEHFEEHAREVDHSVWQGDAMPMDLPCDCNPERPHDSVARGGVVRYARGHALGTKSVFHTDFTRAVSTDAATGRIAQAHLGSQTALPLASKARFRSLPFSMSNRPHASVGEVSIGLSGLPTRCVVSARRGAASAESGPAVAYLHLFDFGVPTSSSNHELMVAYRHLQKGLCMFSIVGPCSPILVDKDPDKNGVSYYTSSGLKSISDISLEVSCYGPSLLPHEFEELFELISITIRPEGREQGCDIFDLRLQSWSTATTAHRRLSWYVSPADIEVAGLRPDVPWSDTTGPCAYFVVQIDGREAGRAYALDFVITGDMSSDWAETGVAEVHIAAVGFDGRVLTTTQRTIPWIYDIDDDDEEWVVVEHAPEYLE